MLFRSPTTQNSRDFDNEDTSPGADSIPALEAFSPIHERPRTQPTTSHEVDVCRTRNERLERKLEAAVERIQVLENDMHALKRQAPNGINQRVTLARPPNLNAIELVYDDVVIIHDGDTNVPTYHLAEDQLREVKLASQTRRRFIAQLSRMMYSIHERSRNTNVSGRQNREMLSPTKTRYKRIAMYTSQMYGCQCDQALHREIRLIIDETNRRFRDDLRMRKYKIQLQADNARVNNVN